MKRVNIVWFRRDLRLTDNHALFEAVESGDSVLPIFIIDPWFYSWSEVGKTRVRFMFESLQELHVNLAKIGSQLLILEGNSVEVLTKLQNLLLQNSFQAQLYFNQDVQTEYGLQRDALVKQIWSSNLAGSIFTGNAYFLLKNEARMDNWRENYYQYQKKEIFPKPDKIYTDSKILALVKQLPYLSLIDLKNKYSQFAAQQSSLFYGGENTAQQVLNSFLDSRFIGYHWKLSRPYMAQLGSTSQLSPHLMFGTISPRQVYQQTKHKISTLDNKLNPKASFALNAFLDRLRWRDSFTQRFWFHPEYTWKNRFPEFDSIHDPGRQLNQQEQEFIERWQNGQTGFPLIDASMRQLKTQGWMNFRMRAMCATFLTINCGLPWQLGAKHYMNYLVDGDMCIDSWQWQMQSGITNPLSPTFRIYNPTKNISEKDPNLEYIHFWVPELRGYNLTQILNTEYVGQTSYTSPMLDFTSTKHLNGKIVSELRRKVRQKIIQEKGLELEDAKISQKVVMKYKESKQEKYQKMMAQNQLSLFEEGNA
ncbi:MAG: FAD-binding domain-containing protein [Patescibacteria group bacterium]